MKKILLLITFIGMISSLFAQKGMYQDMDDYKKGLTFLENGDNLQAIVYFDKAIAFNPYTTLYYYKRGQAHYDLKNYAEALSNFQFCAKALPDEPEYQYLIGICNDKLNKFELAQQAYSNAIAIDPSQLKFYKSRANLFLKTQNYPSEILDFNHILKLVNTDGQSYFYRGVAKFNLQDKESACTDWLSALNNGYTNAGPYIEKNCKKGSDAPVAKLKKSE